MAPQLDNSLILTDADGLKWHADHFANEATANIRIDNVKVVEKTMKLFTSGRSEFRPAFLRHQMCERFINDEQFTDAELKVYAAQGRIPTMFNVIRTYVWHLAGLQRMSRADVRVVGVDKGVDQKLADIAYRYLKYINHSNVQEEVDSLIFRDGLNFMGVWHTYWNPRNGMNGKVEVKRVEPGAVIFDPKTLEIGLDDCGWQTRLLYMTPANIKNKWKIELEFNKEEKTEWWNSLSDKYRSLLESPDAMVVDKQNQLYAVLETFERIKGKYFRIVDAQGNEIQEWKYPLQLANQWMQMNPGFYILPGERLKMKREVIMPYMNTYLNEKIEDYQYYPYTPFISGYMGLRFPKTSSYIYGGLDPQRQKNIWLGNVNEYMQRDLRGGGWVPENKELTKKLNKRGNKVNIWHNVESIAHIPEKVQAAMPAVGMRDLGEAADREQGKVMGMENKASGGVTFSGESGAHRQQLQDETQITLFSVLEMFNKSKGLQAKVALERGIKNTTPQRLIRIIGDDPKKPIDPNIVAALKERGIIELDTRVQDGPYQNEQQREDYVKKMQIFSEIDASTPGIVIPSDRIRGSGIKNEEELAAAMDERYLAMIDAPEPPPGGSTNTTKE